MSYSYTETVKNKARGTKISITAKGTASALQIPKTLAIAAVIKVNTENVTDYIGQIYSEGNTDTETGFVITGTCDAVLDLVYKGTNSSVSREFQLTMNDTSVADADDFKAFIESKLLTYYPSVQIKDFWLKNAQFVFHE